MVAVGEAAPDFKLADQNNKMVSLGSFKKKKSVVVGGQYKAVKRTSYEVYRSIYGVHIGVSCMQI